MYNSEERPGVSATGGAGVPAAAEEEDDAADEDGAA